MEDKILIAPSVKIIQEWPVNFTAADLSDFEQERSYTTYNSFLKNYKNVWISPDSVIYKNGLLIKNSLPAKQYEPYYRLRNLIKKIIKGKKIALPGDKKYLLATDLWSTGHFHWMGDVLPKLACIAEKCKEYTLLLQDSDYTRTIALETIQKMNLCFNDILFMKNENFYKCADLYFLSNLSQSGRYNPVPLQQVRDLVNLTMPDSSRKIYISRKKAQYRKILNEEDLVQLLKNYSFEIVYAEELDFKEQSAIFSSADTFISIHGAGLANCIFMKPGSKVVEIRRKENGPLNVGYWHLAASLGHHYYYYNGHADSELSIVGRGCNITVDLAEFENEILKNL